MTGSEEKRLVCIGTWQENPCGSWERTLSALDNQHVIGGQELDITLGIRLKKQ